MCNGRGTVCMWALRWTDIAGLHYAKQTIEEAIIYPNMRPDLFQGLRAPPKGVLLYGPPGTGENEWPGQSTTWPLE